MLKQRERERGERGGERGEREREREREREILVKKENRKVWNSEFKQKKIIC